jgi:hypothetical protein
VGAKNQRHPTRWLPFWYFGGRKRLDTVGFFEGEGRYFANA